MMEDFLAYLFLHFFNHLRKAVKYCFADDEVAECLAAMTRLGATGVRVVRCGSGYLDPPTTVVVASRSERILPERAGERRRRRRAAERRAP